MLLCQQTHKIHSSYHLVTAEPPFIRITIDCVHQTEVGLGNISEMTYLCLVGRKTLTQSISLSCGPPNTTTTTTTTNTCV